MLTQDRRRATRGLGRPLPEILEQCRIPTKNKLNTTNTHEYKILPTIHVKASGKINGHYGKIYVVKIRLALNKLHGD
jgi:hypothetical protein